MTAGRARLGRVAVVLAVALAVGVAAVAATGLGFGVGPQAADERSGLPPATAKVTRQTLIDARTESGTLGYGAESTVNSRLAGTVTTMAAADSTVQRGQSLYNIDNVPVVLLFGPLPAYRALSVGTKGADVKQFEENLYALGYRGFTVDESYSDSTATAVRKWQADLGLPKTGTVELGRAVYAAGAVRVGARQASVGDAVAPGAPVLTCTGTARVVTVELAVSDQRLAVRNAAVSVSLPDGKKAPGKIARTQTVIKPAEGQQAAQTKIQVTVTVDDETVLTGLDEATMEVVFTASTRKDVLTVPVAALLALAEGGFGVQVVEGGRASIVAVKTGLFAAGRVEVSGDAVTEGMTVGVPS